VNERTAGRYPPALISTPAGVTGARSTDTSNVLCVLSVKITPRTGGTSP
jgi:hypothetical protein